MPYIQNGQVVDKRDWSFEYLADLLSGIYNEVIFFFQTLVSPNAAQTGTQNAARMRLNNPQANSGNNNGRGPSSGFSGGASRVSGMDSINKQTMSKAACGGGG